MLSRFFRMLCLVDGTGLLHQLLPRFLVCLTFELLSTLVRDIAQLVKEAALLNHCRSIGPSYGLASLATPIPDHRLEPVLQAQAPFPQAMDKWLPRRFTLSIRDLPIQDLPLATAITPQPQRDEQHDFLALALLALPLAFVHLDRFRLSLQAQPNAIKLHNGRNISKRFTACELSQRLDLVDVEVRCT